MTTARGAALTLVHRGEQRVNHLFAAIRCAGSKLVGRLGQTDVSSVWVGPLALVLAGSPALAATCHMTVQGVPVIDDQGCAAESRRGEVLVTDAAGDVVRIRGSHMTGRFIVRRPSDGRLRRVTVSYGRVIATGDSDDKTCYFNQRATLCIDP